ncbi:signal transduction histidine kinase [Catenulispora sp. GAS73]|uniref:histidine kinase n=1 Tax=Catenulispora sp. GAS73 TaxID=3156269 RepID=UPI003515DF10
MTFRVPAEKSSAPGAMAADRDLDAERERIAAGLTDKVIHSMFAASLDLHGALALEASEQIHDRVRAAIGELDEAIALVRTTVFDLGYPAAAAPDTLA